MVGNEKRTTNQDVASVPITLRKTGVRDIPTNRLDVLYRQGFKVRFNPYVQWLIWGWPPTNAITINCAHADGDEYGLLMGKTEKAD